MGQTKKKKNTHAKEGLKEKAFKLNFFVNYCEDLGESFLLN